MKKLIVLLFLVGVGTLHAADATNTLSIESIDKSTMDLLTAGNQSQAETDLNGLGSPFKDNQHILFMRACLARSRFLNADAMQIFFLAVLNDPYSLEGMASYWVTQIDRKIHLLESYQKLKSLSDGNSSNPWLQWLLAIEDRALDFKSDGIVRYQNLLAVFKPGPVLMHQTLANLLDESGRFEEALEERKMALSEEERSWSLDGMAITLANLKRYEESFDFSKRAIAMAPNDANILLNYAIDLWHGGRIDAAVEQIGLVIGKNQKWEKPWFVWGQILIDQGRTAEAVEKFKKVVQLNPKHSGALEALSKLGIQDPAN